MALEIGIPYALTSADGTRVVFNDPDDLDFIGYLDGENGLTGLDSPEVRESADNLVERDGGVHGNFYHGRRPVVLQGWIYPEGITQAVVNARIDKLQRASNAMRADAELRWTETGGVEKRLFVRRQQPVRITGRRPKNFQLPLVSERAEIESTALAGVTLDPGAPASTGLSFPWVFPLDFTLPAGGQQFAVNQGTAPTWPFMVITGPITNPRVLNNTTGEEFRLGYDLAAGETLHIDMRARTVLLNGSPGASRYSAVEFPGSIWWALQPGNNDIRLNATAAGGGSQVSFLWAHAWV